MSTPFVSSSVGCCEPAGQATSYYAPLEPKAARREVVALPRWPADAALVQGWRGRAVRVADLQATVRRRAAREVTST
jgi:hypothetical protein